MHVKMVFRFGGLRRAYEFEALLRGLSVPAAAMASKELGWHVVTDTRALVHAREISRFVYSLVGSKCDERLPAGGPLP